MDSSKWSQHLIHRMVAGYSAWFVVDAAIVLKPSMHQCSPELAVAGKGVSRTQSGKLWGLSFSYGSLDSTSTKKLHLRAKGGFTVLVDASFTATKVDQTLFSVQHSKSGFSIVVSFDAATQGYQFNLAKPSSKPTSLFSAALKSDRHVAAFRYQAYTNVMTIDSVAADGTLTNLAQVRCPLATSFIPHTALPHPVQFCFNCRAKCLGLRWGTRGLIHSQLERMW